MIRHRTLDKLIPNPLSERRAWLPGRRSDRAQLRRYRACEVERPFYGHGAKKEYLIVSEGVAQVVDDMSNPLVITID